MGAIHFTFDYELFFGSQSGSVKNCLIDPTNELRAFFEKHGGKGTFFVDVMFLLRMKDYLPETPSLRPDYHSVVEQLRELLREGHQIELHIHPHWLDAIYDGSSWTIDSRRYRLHIFSNEELDLIFKRALHWFQEELGHKPRIFRAGGWCLQPFEVLRPHLHKYEILCDSSVYRGGYLSTPTHFFDFRKAPSQYSWSFSNDPLVVDPGGVFMELSIAATWLSPLRILATILKYKKLKLSPRWGDGAAIGAGLVYKLKAISLGSYQPLSIDGFKWLFLSYQADLLARRQENIVLLSHPKAISKGLVFSPEFEKVITDLKDKGWKIAPM